MKKLLLSIILMSSFAAFSQQSVISGFLFNEKGEPLLYATTVLLNPEDSTMAYYGITNTDGKYAIKGVKAGKYILQTGYMGYESFYKDLEIPLPSGEGISAIMMQPKAQTLNEVQVNADRIPILIKNDTVEYNAHAFKTKPDAAAEELLKKLPGVEVDRAGNIKAQGETVNRVLVDGKEFFGSDPQVATKNLPADAIEKVQVYNKKSDETELTGIDDGTYAKTINMILKDGHKSAYFGDVTVGGGTDERFQGGAKLYRFTKKNQFAALGMLNNINKYGFSFQDYMDFNGGLQSIMSGGGGSISFSMDDNSMPIDFGQAINGLVTSGAGGINFTHEARKNNRFNISYLGNGADKKLLETTYRQNFSDMGSFTQNKDLDQTTENRAHRMNFGWRNRIDTMQNLNINGGASLSNGISNRNSFTESLENDVLMNTLNSLSDDNGNGVNANTNLSYLKRGTNNWKVFKVDGRLSYKRNLSTTEWDNLTNYLGTSEIIRDQKRQEDETGTLNYSVKTSATRKLSKLLYIEPALSIGATNEMLNREHGFSSNGQQVLDSLSPTFSRQYMWLRGGVSFRRNTTKSQLSITAQVENASLSNSLNENDEQKSNYFFFIPRLSWSYQYSTGRRLAIHYSTSVNTPTANQLLPIVNNLNPLQLYSGNRALLPEYSHNIQLNWFLFDQFSSTSVFANMNASYTKDKINFARTILPNFSQEITLLNVDEDYRAGGSIDFSTPIRALGVNLNAKFRENWNRGTNFVNDIENINTNYSHKLTLDFNNRKTEKWDLLIGGSVQLTDAKYSVQSELNRTYFNLSGYTDISYTPNKKWYFLLSADVTRYDAQSFGSAVSIPIIRAEMTRYFLNNNRGVLTLEVFDLLDKNKGLERISEMNYLLERRSNVIGRYFMLSFKYRINKFNKKSGGIQIKMDRRR